MSETDTGVSHDETVDEVEATDDRPIRPFTDRGIGILLTIGSAIGLFSAFELMADEVKILRDPNYTPGCSLSILVDCKSVINSVEGEVFGFPNPMMGLIGFGILVAIGVAAAAGTRFPRWYWVGTALGLTFGFGLIQWFATEAIFVMEVLCPWCMVVWTFTVPMFWYTALHVLGKFTRARWLRFLQSWHAIPVVLWYLTVITLIFVHFWDYYWKGFFADL